MIQKLIDTALARLRDELATLISQPDDHIVVGPVATPEQAALPLIVLAPGPFKVRQSVKEPRAGAPRPQPAHQRIALTAGAGPYPLGHTPLQGTARGALILDEGALTERREMMLEGQHFEIDYQQPAVTVTRDLSNGTVDPLDALTKEIYTLAGKNFNLNSSKQLSGVLFIDLGLPPQSPLNKSGYYSTATSTLKKLAGQYAIIDLVLQYRELKKQPASGVEQPPGLLVLDYSFAGVFTIREFQQTLLIDLYDTDPAAVEKWASLTAGILLTHLDELFAGAKTQYPSQKSVTTTHAIDQLELVEGTPLASDGKTTGLQLTFNVTGSLQLIKEITEGVGLIEQIHSPGKTPTDGVDIDIGVA